MFYVHQKKNIKLYFLPNPNNLTAVGLRLIGMHNEQNVIFENG